MACMKKDAPNSALTRVIVYFASRLACLSLIKSLIVESDAAPLYTVVNPTRAYPGTLSLALSKGVIKWFLSSHRRNSGLSSCVTYIYTCYKPKAINWRRISAYGDNCAVQVSPYEINYGISRIMDIDYGRSVDIAYNINGYVLDEPYLNP